MPGKNASNKQEKTKATKKYKDKYLLFKNSCTQMEHLFTVSH
jgi:hypothetical protein